MKHSTVTAPILLVWNIWVSRTGTESKVVGTFAPRIDYPGGIEAYAEMVWVSVEGQTSKDETRWVERCSRVTL